MPVNNEASDLPKARGGDRAAVADLSDRQYACLVRAGEGMSSKEIGRLLGISPSTVDNHIHVAVQKLHAKNRWQAAQLLHPERRRNGAENQARVGLIPPLGGAVNSTTTRARIVQMLAIAAISIIVLTSAVVLVLGAFAVFGGK